MFFESTSISRIFLGEENEALLHLAGQSIDFDEFGSVSGSKLEPLGCPLGTLLFCLSVVDIVAAVAARHPSVQVVGFVDDYRFVGPAEEALAAANEYLQRVEARGHVSQVAKAKLYTPSAHVLAHRSEWWNA